MSREEVHDWTLPWVEPWLDGYDDGPAPSDPMINWGLQYLHGFTMAHLPETPNLIHHGPPGVYVKSLDDIRADLDYWYRNRDEFDEDPEGWRARRRAVAQEAVRKEMERRQDPR